MTQDERRELNEKIGREFFGWKPYRTERVPEHLDGGLCPPLYCTDCLYVVSLAEALRERGRACGEDWFITMTSWCGWHVSVKHGMIGDVIAEARADTLPAALALAAARAVGSND